MAKTKKVSDRFDGSLFRYYVAHAQQQNVWKSAEPTSNTKDWQKKGINEMSKKELQFPLTRNSFLQNLWCTSNLNTASESPSNFRTCEPFKFSNAMFFYPYLTEEKFSKATSFRQSRRICDTKTLRFLRLSKGCSVVKHLEPMLYCWSHVKKVSKLCAPNLKI